MLILELAERDLLTKMQQSVIEIDQAESIIQDLLRALSDIHKQGFVHRNIDPSNIVFTHTHKLKVIDFGRAEFLGHQQSLSTTELNLSKLKLIQNILRDTKHHNLFLKNHIIQV
jgi:serine/threonine protein kinase